MSKTFAEWIRVVAGESDQETVDAWAAARSLSPSWRRRAEVGAKGLTKIDGPWTPMTVTLHSDQESILAMTMTCALMHRDLARAGDHHGLGVIRPVVEELARACKHHRWREEPSPTGMVASVLAAMDSQGVRAPAAAEAEAGDSGTSGEQHPEAPREAAPPRPKRTGPAKVGTMLVGRAEPRQLAALAVVVVLGAVNGLLIWMDSRPIDPPPFAAYATIIPMAESQWMEKDRFVLQVAEQWAELDPWEREDQIDTLMMATGSLSWTIIEIRAPDGRRYATLNSDWDIIWHGRAKDVAEAFASADDGEDAGDSED